MSPLETSLVILVSIWSIIFIIIAIALLIILKEVKKALDKVNSILDTTESITQGVGGPVKTVVSTISAFLKKAKASKK
ncbi:hypothetical protein HY025_00590 [Candidatus Daviesbacteria bacterium]|nr:hypothetical protein [Candidatus Daviesbacteria bacterium]